MKYSCRRGLISMVEEERRRAVQAIIRINNEGGIFGRSLCLGNFEYNLGQGIRIETILRVTDLPVKSPTMDKGPSKFHVEDWEEFLAYHDIKSSDGKPCPDTTALQRLLGLKAESLRLHIQAQQSNNNLQPSDNPLPWLVAVVPFNTRVSCDQLEISWAIDNHLDVEKAAVFTAVLQPDKIYDPYQWGIAPNFPETTVAVSEYGQAGAAIFKRGQGPFPHWLSDLLAVACDKLAQG